MSKVARKGDKVEAPVSTERELVLSITPSVPAFKAYLRTSKAVNDRLMGLAPREGETVDVDAIMGGMEQVLDMVYEWLTTYGGMAAETLDTFSMWDVVACFRQAAVGFALPKTKSAP